MKRTARISVHPRDNGTVQIYPFQDCFLRASSSIDSATMANTDKLLLPRKYPDGKNYHSQYAKSRRCRTDEALAYRIFILRGKKANALCRVR